MNKAVLISVQPQWCELIASGKKTVEVRKSFPKIETPFKCYIYQSKKSWVYNIYGKIADWQGKVIGEFVCDEIYNYTADPFISAEIKAQCTISDEEIVKQSCLTLEQLYHYEYSSDSHNWGLLVWHISELVIYDEPKELSAFDRPHDYIYQSYRRKNSFFKGITKPPQSWCYVEEAEV